MIAYLAALLIFLVSCLLAFNFAIENRSESTSSLSVATLILGTLITIGIIAVHLSG